MLQKLLEMKLSKAVQEQVLAGVGTVPKNDADDILTRVAQLDATKIRGLVIIAASDIDNGVDVQTLMAGTPATLDPLMGLAVFQISEKLQNPDTVVEGEVCPGCGEVHGSGEDFLDQLLRRGSGTPPRPQPNEDMLGGLGLLLALSAMGRKR